MTAIFQVVIIWISGSAALLADTMHNFADVHTTIQLWIAFVWLGFSQADPIVGDLVSLVVIEEPLSYSSREWDKLFPAKLSEANTRPQN